MSKDKYEALRESIETLDKECSGAWFSASQVLWANRDSDGDAGKELSHIPQADMDYIAAANPAAIAALLAERDALAQPAEPLPQPGIHAAVHYATWLRREAHREQKPRAGALRNAARMIDVLLAERRRLIQELIDADALVAERDALAQQTVIGADGIDAVRADLIADLREVFDANGLETPQSTRDVIEYVDSWLSVFAQRQAGGRDAP